MTGSLTIDGSIFATLYDANKDSVLFFQFGWKEGDGDRYGTSPPWAFAENQDAANRVYGRLLSSGTTMLATSTVGAMYNVAATPYVDPASTALSSEPGASSPSASAASTSDAGRPSSSSASHQRAKSGALSTGAIIGIAIGGFATLLLALLSLGLLCLRRRGSHRGLHDPVAGRRASHHHHPHSAITGGGGSRDMQTLQDLMLADKERRADSSHALDTPYTEEGPSISQRDLRRPLTLSGLGGAGALLQDHHHLTDAAGAGAGDGDAGETGHPRRSASFDDDSDRDDEEVFNNHTSTTTSNNSNNNNDSTRRSSAGYTSLRGLAGIGAARAEDRPPHRARSSPSSSSSSSYSASRHDDDEDQGQGQGHGHGRASLVAGTAAHRASSSSAQQVLGRAFSPYRDRDGCEHQQHQQGGDNSNNKNDAIDDENDNSPTVTMTTDRGEDEEPPPPGLPGGGSGAGTPRLGRSSTPGPGPISEQYAHLVEEGMTEEEMRRLEEEERVLDEAIEQARTESRATGRKG